MKPRAPKRVSVAPRRGLGSGDTSLTVSVAVPKAVTISGDDVTLPTSAPNIVTRVVGSGLRSVSRTVSSEPVRGWISRLRVAGS
jgi:hypothetical protein